LANCSAVAAAGTAATARNGAPAVLARSCSMSSKHSPPTSCDSASDTTSSPPETPRRRRLTGAARPSAANSPSISSTKPLRRASSPTQTSPANGVSASSSARKTIRPGPLSPSTTVTASVTSIHTSWQASTPRHHPGPTGRKTPHSGVF